MNPGEPMTVPVWVSTLASAAREIPKSITRGPSSASSTFEGFRSRCTRPAAWIASRPSASPAASVSTEATGSGPWASTASASDGPATYAVASHGTGPCDVRIRHRRGEQPAHRPGSGHFPREPGPEPGLPGQLRADHLHRHQPAPGRTAQEHLAHTARSQPPQQPVRPHGLRIPCPQAFHHGDPPANLVTTMLRTVKCPRQPRLRPSGPAARRRPPAAAARPPAGSPRARSCVRHGRRPGCALYPLPPSPAATSLSRRSV